MIVWWVGAALAFEPQSLRSSASFGLFRDAYDDLREPAMLTEWGRPHVYSVLGNQGGTDRFSLGGLGPVGPLAIGGIAEVGGGLHHAELRADEADGTWSTRTSDDQTLDAGGFLGVATAWGSRGSVGLGVGWSEHRRQTTLVAVPGSLPVVGGQLTSQYDADGTVRSQEDGEWTERARDLELILGLARRGDVGEIEADLRWTHEAHVAAGWARLTSIEVDASSDGFLPGAPIEDNLVADAVGGAVDATVAVGDGLTLRVQASGTAGGGRPSVRERVDSLTAPTGTTSSRESLADPAARTLDGQALIAAQGSFAGLEARVGAAIEGSRERMTASRTVSDASGTVEGVQDVAHRYLVVSAPLAIEAMLSQRVTVRLGGRYALGVVGYGSTVREGPRVDVAEVLDLWSRVELASGVRVEAHDRLYFDATVLGASDPAQRASLDLGQVFLSAVWR